MKYLKNYCTSITIIIISLLSGNLLLTLLSYFDLISDKTLSILITILLLFTMFISGFLIGKKSFKKGWLEGIKMGLIFYLFLLFINIIFIKDFSFKIIIYLLILILPTMLGSMIGILKK